jgi:hypothetical protein
MSSAPTPNPQPSGMFSEPEKDKSFPTTAVAIAAVAVVILVAVLVMLGRKPKGPAANVEQAVSSYGDNLRVSNVQLSQSESLSGGKSTYIDGHVENAGDKTIMGIQVQVFFANDAGTAPTIDTVPLMLIRTREPYVDVQPVSAAPIAPGAGADFRLIFENVPENWNEQTPVMHAVQVATK